MEELYHFRLHYEPYNLSEILEYIKSKADVLICVHETATRNHIHTVLIFKQTKSTFFQQFLKKYSEYKGNKSYSCEKVKKKDDMIAYCCKGLSSDILPEVLIKSDDICVVDYHTQYWKVNAIVMEKKEVNMGCQNGSSLVSKAKSKSWSERVFEQIQDELSSECDVIISYNNGFKLTDSEQQLLIEAKRKVFRMVVRCLGKSVKKINENIIRDLYSGFINSILQKDETAGNAYADKLFNAFCLYKQ